MLVAVAGLDTRCVAYWLFCDLPLSGCVSFNAASPFVKESLHYRQVSHRKPTFATA
jgi:hypothetical protein